MSDPHDALVEDLEQARFERYLDPDPLTPTDVDRAYALGFADAWESTRPPGRVSRLGLVAIVAAAAALLIAGVVIGRASAAPRSGQTTERFDMSPPSSAGLSGAPHVAAGLHATAPSGAPQPTEPPAIAAGLASWYPADGLVAAVPGWRFGDTPYRVRVTYGGRSVIVTVQDCLCGRSDRLIDLSDDAFRELAPLSRGVIPVMLEDLAGPGATPPPTDTQP